MFPKVERFTRYIRHFESDQASVLACGGTYLYPRGQRCSEDKTPLQLRSGNKHRWREDQLSKPRSERENTINNSLSATPFFKTMSAIKTHPPVFTNFRDAYNGCFTNGISLAESTTIHIKRAITTLSANSGDFRHMQLTIELPAVVSHKDPFSAILHETYPKGFFSDNLFIGVEIDEQGGETCVFVMHDLTVNGRRRQFEIAYIPCDKFDALYTKLKSFEFDPPVHIEVVRCIASDGTIDAVNVKYDAKESFEAHPEFYPFVKELKGFDEDTTIEDIINDFMLAKANLLFFIGKPGSAKSTLIRSFFRKGFDVRLINNAAVLESPALPSTFRMESPENGDRLLTVYEDADRFVSSRKDGNMSVSAMLNQLDGAVGSKEKFIISTNLESLRSVDPAILRRGRCHRVFEFRDLTPEEVNIARKAVGMEPIDTDVALSVADALNWDGVTAEKRKATPMGFTA